MTTTDLAEVAAPLRGNTAAVMTPSEIVRSAGSLEPFGKIGSFGVFYGKNYDYLFFSRRLLPRMELRFERGDVPPGSAFVYVCLKGKPRLALKVPCRHKGRSVSYEWTRKLTRNLSSIEDGHPSRARRNARLNGQKHYHTSGDIRLLWQIQGGRCYYSGVSLGETLDAAVFAVDHITPLFSGGHDGPMNLALVAPIINKRKGSNLHSSFIRQLRIGKAGLARIREINRLREGTFIKMNRTKAPRMR